MRLLFVNSCLRGKVSRTLALCESFIDEMKSKNPNLEMKEIDLNRENITALNQETLMQRNSWIKEGDFKHLEFDAAKEFASADMILVGAPFWDMSFPAVLRTYMEHISVNQITFRYAEAGSEGLCRAKKMIYLSTAGGFVPEFHMGEAYMKQMCQLYGIDEFHSFCLEGLDIEGVDVDRKMEEAKETVKELVKKDICL